MPTHAPVLYSGHLRPGDFFKGTKKSTTALV